ncbi:MAG: efflux RND transporter periplasmic adaptor subunit [Planctomycetota bacterium]|nr:efflux RND transporter periplasmic adaptor subunit [Planctomycetota bacterium]
MKSRTLTVLIVLAVAAGAAFLIQRGKSGSEAAPASAPQAPPPAVTIAPAEGREIAETTEFTGRLGAVDDVEIRPRVSGHVDEVHFRSGQLVKRGDPLFTIDARYYRANLAAAEAQIVQARVKLDTADREAARSAQLLEARAISIEEAEGRTARQAEARAALLSAEAARDLARLDVEYTRIVAPVDGRVSRALVTPGNFVSGIPSANTLLTTIVSVDPIFVYVDVDENSLLHLQRLMRANELPHDAEGRVQVEVGLADEDGFPRAGVVESLGNRLDTGTGSILMRVQVPNHDGILLPGLFARVRMPTTAKQPTVLVNQRAIGTDQSQKFVYVVGADNVAQYRAITLGPVVDGLRIVRTGLSAGEQIVVNGLQRIRPGTPVTPEHAQPKPEGR